MEMVDNKLAFELQQRLVQTCIDYINEIGNTDIQVVSFTADCLQESCKVGEWCPATDSYCSLKGYDYDNDNDYLISESY